MRKIIVILIFASVSAHGLNKSRKIETKNDEVSEVKTALGIATKIILSEAPNSAPIIGDMGAFRIEPIDKGYAIKPLRYGAKTNLFISTDSRSYAVRLSMVTQDAADYTVYLCSKEEKIKSQIAWRDFRRRVKSENFILETKRIGKSQDGFVILEYSISSKMMSILDPELFFIYQGKESKSIHSLIFSSKEVTSERAATAALTLDRRALSSELPAVFEIKGRDGLRLEIPREFLWRK